MLTLLDTNVLSELTSRNPMDRVVEFVTALDPMDAFVSVISIGELAFGVARLPMGRRQSELTDWLNAIKAQYSKTLIGPDVETAQIWGDLNAMVEAAGRDISTSDRWIAATALQHEMRLATRNTKDFLQTGISLVNPWEP